LVKRQYVIKKIIITLFYICLTLKINNSKRIKNREKRNKEEKKEKINKIVHKKWSAFDHWFNVDH